MWSLRGVPRQGFRVSTAAAVSTRLQQVVRHFAGLYAKKPDEGLRAVNKELQSQAGSFEVQRRHASQQHI